MTSGSAYGNEHRPWPVLRERETASQVVSQVLAQAQQGAGRALFVLGDAGMGKTALLDLARATAADTMWVPQAKGSLASRGERDIS